MIAEKLQLVGGEEIITTAEMLFRTQGFDNTTVQDISNQLNISDSQFFHYFESVDEILELLWSGLSLSRDRNEIQTKSNKFHLYKGGLP